MKRIFDVTLALVGLVLVFPFLLVMAVAVRLSLGSPVIFRQSRPGLGGRLFVLYKFRTMIDLGAAEGAVYPDSERLTKFGKVLRNLSLDELPELVNVIKGDMSLVGPRPLLVEYLPLYSPEQARRHSVQPGITGWAQVNGRNATSWRERLDCDIWYVDHRSFLLDLRILLMTVVMVLKREGITQEGQATMQRFTGNGDLW